MDKILITGGAGFIGSHVCQLLLAQGRRVVVLDDFNDYYDPRFKRENAARFLGRSDFRLVEGDIRDRELVERLYLEERFDATLHLAARAGVRPSIREPQLYVEVNELGTVNLLEAARRSGASTFIFGSSSSVYGINSKVPFAEQDPITRPVSPYAATKRAGELLCHTYHHLYGLRVTCLRFFTVYGPRQRPEMAIYSFTERMLAGRPVPMFGDGSSARDYTFIDDIADGILRSLAAAHPWEIVNLGGSRTTTLRSLIELIAAAAGVSPAIERLPDQPGDVPITSADVSHAREALGWAPTVAIEEGIRRFVDWYRAERAGDAPRG
jgi:UDP-glucuronate 4-epimerase